MSRVTLRNVNRIPELLLRYFNILTDRSIPIVGATDATNAMGYTEVAEDLLLRGASPSAPDHAGLTPLSYAQRNNNEEMVELLLDPHKGRVRRSERAIRTALVSQQMKYIISQNDITLLESTLCTMDAQHKSTNCDILMIQAASCGMVKAINVIMQHGGKVTARDSDGNSALAKGVIAGSLPVVQHLIELGAPVDDADDEGVSPLHHACTLGLVDIASLLVKCGAQVNTKDNDQVSPLHQAVSTEGIVKMLLDHKASVDAVDSTNSTPLHIAAFENQLNIGRLLIHAGANVNAKDASGLTALHSCCFLGYEDFTRLLLQSKDIDCECRDDNLATPYHNASFGGHYACLSLLLSHKRPTVGEADGCTTSLHHAAFGGHVKCMQVIIESGANVNVRDAEGATPLHKASYTGHLEAMELLLSRGADVSAKDGEGSTPLHKASYQGEFEAMRSLIDHGAETDAQDDEDGTALHNACFNGHLAAVELLLSSQANVNCADAKGASPLHLAVLNGHVDVASLLMERGAVANSPDDRGMIALHFAIAHSACLAFLLDKEPDLEVDYKDKSNRTPLFYASKNGCDESVRMLVNRGANVYATDKNGRTPFDVAESSFQPTLVEAMRDRESQQDSETQKKFQSAARLFNQKASKGIEYLKENKLGENSSMEVAIFLYRTQLLNKKAIGDYLGEGDAFNKSVMKDFVDLMDFAGLDFDDALRHFLSKFTLPGEAQKIDRLMETFAVRFCSNNPSIFDNQDSAYILAFSLIMLNTDAHSAQVKNKMSKNDFIKRTKPIISPNIPTDYLSNLYDKIVKNEIKMHGVASSMFAAAEMKGWCHKQGGRHKNWKRRWFVLKDNCLYYFKSENPDQQPCGIIPLENVLVRSTSIKGHKHSYEVYTADGMMKSCKKQNGQFVRGHHGSYLISTASVEEMNAWMQAIQANVAFNPLHEMMMARTVAAAKERKEAGKTGGKDTINSDMTVTDFAEFHEACLMCSIVGRSLVSVKETYGSLLVSTGEEANFRYMLISNPANRTQYVVFAGNLTEQMVATATNLRPWQDLYKVLNLDKPLESFSRTILPLLKRDFSLEIYGHSLGGTLAILFAQRASANRLRRVITFGQPKIVKTKDSANFTRLPAFRVIECSDVASDQFNGMATAGTTLVLFEDSCFSLVGGEWNSEGMDKRIENNNIDVYLRNLKTKTIKKPIQVPPYGRKVSSTTREASSVYPKSCDTFLFAHYCLNKEEMCVCKIWWRTAVQPLRNLWNFIVQLSTRTTKCCDLFAPYIQMSQYVGGSTLNAAQNLLSPYQEFCS
ncbi:ankyrin repeat-containing protein [Planoprotostelium fungivorum]|uniref:Ankyrin repeat-containing protein n=1 Tax=Planoprotostelium fungivorum TaxID=1890364 RepID=A0A2P6NBZ4_9EUKA|nr:ankyrin repeat-containing protein [Planoprotostelium fungivorum]